MALNDDATLVIAGGDFFTADYVSGSPEPLPADLSAPGVNWEKAGHTSLSDVFGLESEGGDETTLGTLQNKALRTTRAARIDSLTFNLQQFDTASLQLFFGSNATIGSNGEVQVPSDPQPTTCSFLAVFTDGTEQFAIYAPKVEIFRADNMAVSDAESLASLPLRVKFLQHSTNTWFYSVTPIGEAGS